MVTLIENRGGAFEKVMKAPEVDSIPSLSV